MTLFMPAFPLAQLFPLQDAMRLYEASQLPKRTEREAEVDRVIFDLKRLHPHLFRPEALRSTIL